MSCPTMPYNQMHLIKEQACTVVSGCTTIWRKITVSFTFSFFVFEFCPLQYTLELSESYVNSNGKITH